MTPTLQRLTTEFIAAEDRLRLAGSTDDGSAQVIWVSRRLLRLLIPQLQAWLEGQVPLPSHGQAVQEFAQQAARAALQPQAPVLASEQAETWLAHAIDIARTPQFVQLTFRGASGARQQQALILFEVEAMRQWLAILYDKASQADWELNVWPAWLRGGAVDVALPQSLLH